MRTTVQIQDALLEEAKREAISRQCTLGNVIEDALRKTLLDARREDRQPHTEIITYRGRGLRAGINLDSNADLLDAMEAE